MANSTPLTTPELSRINSITMTPVEDTEPELMLQSLEVADLNDSGAVTTQNFATLEAAHPTSLTPNPLAMEISSSPAISEEATPEGVQVDSVH